MKMIMMPCVAAILLGIIAVFSGCGSESIDPGNKDRLFLFGMRTDPDGKEDFVAVTSDKSVIAAVNGQLAKPVDERTLQSVVPEKPVDDSDIACTMEAKQCPDGTYVGRIPPDCEFAPCPAEKAQ